MECCLDACVQETFSYASNSTVLHLCDVVHTQKQLLLQYLDMFHPKFILPMMKKYNFVLLKKKKVGQLLKSTLGEVTKGTLRLVTTPKARSMRPPSKSKEATKLQMRRKLENKQTIF